MIRWSLMSEYLAMILIVVIMLFFYDKRRNHTFRRQLYWACLGLSLVSILLNVICVYTIENTHIIPTWVNLLLNSAYFLVSVLMSGAVAFYLFQRVLEFVYDKHCLYRAIIGVSTVQILYFLLILWNLSSGVIFSFDATGHYQRGPLNSAGYLALGAEMVLLVLCYIRNRKSVEPAMIRVMRTVPTVVALLVALQLAYPGHLLNGTIIAMTDLIIYISFQCRRIEQDSLTGIGNRKSLFHELSLRTAGKQGYQLVAVGLKQFARVNQQFGHSMGDDILCQIATCLDQLPGGGRAFRSGNVEFVVMCPCRDEEEGRANLERVLAPFREEWILGEVRCRVDICAANLIYQGEDWTPEQILEYLKYTIQLAKEEHRQLARFDGETAQRYQRRDYLIHTIRRAIEDKRFQVWYQPIYQRETGRFTTAEALLRLKDYEGRPVGPDEFIPIMENLGMLDEVCWFLLDQVCRLLGSGQAPGLNSVSINLSMQQFLRKDLLERIEGALNRYQVEPGRLKLELTERVLLEDTDYVQTAMKEMVEHGLRFYLDDFGTGYSNLSCALDLPFESVKLDRSLLSGLPDDPRVRLLAETLITFFHRLGKTVVAEGIETQAQADQVLNYGADRIQGFHYARPMPENELKALFQRQAGS